MKKIVKVLVLSILIGCLPSREKEQAFLPNNSTLKAGFIIVPGVFNTELMAPMDIFQHTMFHTKFGIEVFTIAATKEPVKTFEGLSIIPDFSFADSLNIDIDILVVPSAKNSMGSDLSDSLLLNFVSNESSKATYIISLCDGAFILAKSGLLSGKSCTTFPKDIDYLKETFTDLKVIKNVSFVHDGNIITSVGGIKSYDAALYLVDIVYGEEVTKNVASGLVIDWDKSSLKYKAIK